MPRQFSPYEFALVIGVAFGVSIATSIIAFTQGLGMGYASSGFTFGPSHLYGVVMFEAIVGPVVAVILYVRGWRLRDFPLGVANLTTVIGIATFLLAWALGFAFHEAMRTLSDNMAQVFAAAEADPYQPTRSPGLFAITLLSIVNPVFEEAIVVGYVIPALERRFGTTAAVNASAIIRGLYHLYQGPFLAPFHFSYGLIQAYVYVKLRRLWPLFVSHALGDFVPLILMG